MNVSPKESKTPAARALADLQSEILAAWEASARREIDAAAALSQPILIDTVPLFLENLAEALAEEHPRLIATECSNVSEEHGGERARLSEYAPDHLIQEYQLLRNVIFDKLGGAVRITERDHRIITSSVDHAIRESIMAFFIFHQRIREQFVATLTHDLRQPIAATRMAADLILQTDDPQNIKNFANRIVTNAKRLDRMIQDLLDATATQFGHRLPLKLSSCDVAVVLKDLVTDLDPKQAERIVFHATTQACLWDVETIRRAVLNLITNAFKYGRNDTPVTLKVDTNNGRVTISVHNEGVPISFLDRELLFEPFRRSERAKKSGKTGWGIGLSLVRAVAQAHGGSISVESGEGFGTNFRLDLPADARPFQSSLTIT